MRLFIRILAPALAGFLCSAAVAQQSQNPAAPAVPNLIRFAGSYHATANPPAGPIGATFAIYAEQEGGTPLWTEDQNIELDADGNYTVLLGSAKNEGVPLQLFPAGEARWVQVKLYTPAEGRRCSHGGWIAALRTVPVTKMSHEKNGGQEAK